MRLWPGLRGRLSGPRWGGPSGNERGSTAGDQRDGEDASAGTSHPTRRDALLVAGGAVGLATGGSILSTDGSFQGRIAPPTGSPAASDREDFLWLGPGQWAQERLRENLLAFAGRHDLQVAFAQPPSNTPGVGETVRPALEAAGAFGIDDPWFNLGVFRDMTPAQFLADADARERHLDGLREVATLYGDLFDGGRIVVWQEAPVMGRWTESGEWNEAAVENLLSHGPAAFDAQKTALQRANPDLDVGIFVHFPYLVDSKRPGVFADLAASLRDRGAAPDFAFTDFYRGWYEKDAGPGPADRAVRSLVSNAREHLGGREVFYIGQAHTINPGHTPSAEAIDSNLRASVDGGASGLGWYLAGGCTPTETGFDPLVPNAADAEFDGDTVNTLTAARDRFLYAWTTTFARQYSTDDRFELWLHGDDFEFYSHRLSARTADGEWALLGDFGGYVDGDYPHAGNRTTIFRALERSRFLAEGTLELRIDTDADASGNALDAVHAMPWDPDSFLTEREATARLERGGGPAVDEFELGRATPSARLTPGESLRVTVPVTGGSDQSASLSSLAQPEYADAVRQLAAAAERQAFDPDDRFDLWLAGTGLASPDAAPSLFDADGDRVAPATACVVPVSTADTALYYGLERERFLDGGLSLAGDGDAGTRVETAYAMPHAGSRAFRPPSRAAAVLADQPREVATFAVERADL